MKGDYLKVVYHLQAEIDQSHNGLTSVGVPEWPSMSLVNKFICT